MSIVAIVTPSVFITESGIQMTTEDGWMHKGCAIRGIESKDYFTFIRFLWDQEILIDCDCYHKNPVSKEEDIEIRMKIFEFMSRAPKTPFIIHLAEAFPSVVKHVYEYISFLSVNFGYHGCICRRCLIEGVKDIEDKYGDLYIKDSPYRSIK